MESCGLIYLQWRIWSIVIHYLLSPFLMICPLVNSGNIRMYMTVVSSWNFSQLHGRCWEVYCQLQYYIVNGRIGENQNLVGHCIRKDNFSQLPFLKNYLAHSHGREGDIEQVPSTFHPLGHSWLEQDDPWSNLDQFRCLGWGFGS